MAADEHEKPVGYANPPAHARFQKGRSGNPKGKPKGALNASTNVLQRILNQRIEVQDRATGQTRKVSAIEIALRRMVDDAVQGDLKAIEGVMALSIEFGGFTPDAAHQGGGVLVVERYLTQEEWQAQNERYKSSDHQREEDEDE